MAETGEYTVTIGKDEYTLTGPKDQVAAKIAELRREATAITAKGAATSAARGSARGVITGLPVVAGTMMGGKIGAAGGSFFGPVGTVAGGVLGALIGAGAGGLAGEAASKQIAKTTGVGGENVEGEQYQPFYRAGEAVGAAVPFMAAPFAYKPSTTGTAVLDPVLRSAQAAPKAFFAGETAAAAGAGVGAGAASAVSDDDPTARMVGEIVGGTLSPAALVSRVSGNALSGLRTAIRSQTKAGREQEAAQVAQDFVRSRGGEPEDVARRLEAEGVVAGAEPTAAQKTASEGLMALERGLLRGEREAGAEVDKQLQATLKAQADAIRNLPDTGNPAQLKAYAEARQKHWHGLMQARIAQAQREARELAARIDPNDPTAREVANRQARELLDDARQDARTVENALWRQMPNEAVLSVQPGEGAGARAINEARAGLLRTEELPLPRELNDFLDDIAGGGEFELGDVQRGRSRILEEARDMMLGDKPKPDMARRLFAIGDGLADDMASVSPEAAAARDFTFQRVRNFGRGEARKILRRAGGGDQRPASLALEEGVAKGGPRGAESVDDLRQAVTPIETDVVSGVPAGRVEQMTAEQETVVRNMAGRVVDPETRTVNPNALARWRENNTALLDRFPELRGQLADTESVQRLLGERMNIYERAPNVVKQRAAFNRLAEIEDTNAAVSKALRGDNPRKDLGAMARLARSDQSGEAMKGLRQAVTEVVLDEVTDNRGMISGAGLTEFLDSPLAKDMTKSGTLTKGMRDRLKAVADELETFETAMRAPADADKVMAEPDNLFDLLVRAAGANIGASSGLARASGAQLVLAGYGSRMARRIMERIPQGRVKHVLIDAVRDPKLMAELMRKPTSPRHALAIERRINAYLLQAGLVPKED